MTELLQMDIFFFVTTVAVVLLGTFGTIVLWRVSRVLKNVEHLSKQAALESDLIRSDLVGMRTDIRRGKGRLKSMFRFLGKISMRARK